MKNINPHKKVPDWKSKVSEIRNLLLGIVYEFASFITVVFRPWNVILFPIAVTLLYYSQTQNGTTKIILDWIFAAISGVLGGLLWNYYTEFRGNSFLIKKSSAAIRNLRLIKYKVDNISNRINGLYSEVNKRDFEEISNLTQNIQKDIINSISDWGDITPAVTELTDYLEITNQAETKYKEEVKEKKDLEKKLAILDKGKTKEIEDLRKEIQNKEISLDKLRKSMNYYDQLPIAYTGFTSGVLGTSNVGSANYIKTDDLGSLTLPDYQSSILSDLISKSK